MNEIPSVFQYASLRARKARMAAVFDSKALRVLIWICVIGFVVLWVLGVIVIHKGLFNLFLAPLSVLLFIVIWYYGELKDLKTDMPITGVHSVLERQLLAKLKPNMSPKEIGEIVAQTRGGRFFAVRFGLSKDILSNLSSGAVADTDILWQQVITIVKARGQTEISSACVVVALMQIIKDKDLFLAQLQLDNEALFIGLSWYENIEKTIESISRKRFVGGIGRDLAFGYAPLLNRLGLNMTNEVLRTGMLHRTIDSRLGAIDQIMQTLTDGTHRNVMLVGEEGTGKTTLLYALTQKIMEDPIVPKALHYNQVIELDAGMLISNARDRGALEGLIIQLLNEAASAKNIILFLDDAQLFFSEGPGSVDLSKILLPVLQAGGMRIIFAMSTQDWTKLSQLNPGLTQLMNRVIINEPSPDETIQVMEDQVLLLESQYKVAYLYQSLHEAYRMAERYIREQAFPRRGVRLLDAAAKFAESGFVTANSVQQAVESTFDVKVALPNNEQERDTLLNLEGRIHERMINQVRAVQVVSDALRRARSGVGSTDRPVGTFLFLGPTGVGKTELSKALADVYFGGEDKLVRLDLNEFSHPDDVARLISTASEGNHSLTSQIARQPFSVVLLDEIEKAHENVLNVLLQLLDEGMMRDSENKEVSFRDAIVIATSNAGADIIRQHIENGEQLEQFEDALVSQLVDSGQFRPEFLNRFDEIVLFRPLNQTELLQVIDLLLAGINKTLASQQLAVELTTPAKQFLVTQGYDPRLGARPMRRMVQRTVENIVAQRILNNQAPAGSIIQLDTPDLMAVLDRG